MPVIFTKIFDILSWPARLLSWLILPLIASIIVGVVLAKMGRNALVSFESPLPVLGRAISVNSLVDMQWYIFALIVLFGAIWALRDDKHVSVDFLWLMMSPRQQIIVRILGDLFFLTPFCAIIAWYGWGFTEVAWRTAEGSTQGGLNSRWLIKAMVPLSFAMLALFGVLRAIGGMIELIRGPRANTANPEAKP